MENKRNSTFMRNVVLCVVAGVLVIFLIVLIIFYAQSKNNSNNNETISSSSIETSSNVTTEDVTNSDATSTDSVTTTEAPITEAPTTEAPTTEAPTTEAPTTEAPTTQAPTTEVPTTTVAQVPGNWDLAALDTKTIPYGNNPEDTLASGIPSGVFWYSNQWHQYNADFISDMGIKYNKGETTEKVIYLTMDCGFDNEHTGPILDILKEKNVKATFFVTSMFYDARPDLIERMINEGHRIGSHSINHYDMTTLSVDVQKTEILDVVNKLKKDYNYDCKLFRYPTGNFSTQSLALVDNLGMKSVFWSYAYNDYSSVQPEVQPSYEKAVKYLHPGAIFLLHASSSTNRAFLGDWIDAARSKGYEFAGVYPID